MNFKKMQILVEIAKHKNITKAANALGIKQPTVTFHMKSLEEELRLTLFKSISGKIFLTDAGNALLHYAKRIMLLSNDATRLMEAFSIGQNRNFKIGASMVPAAFILPKILGGFKELYPTLPISLTVMTAPSIRQMLCNYKLDIGIISTDYVDLDEIYSSKLCDDRMVLVYSPLHPLATHKEVSLDIAKDQNFILHTSNSTTRKLIDQWSEDNNISIKPYMEIGSTEVIKKALINNIGVSILSELSVMEEFNSNKLKFSKLPGSKLNRGIYIIYNRERYMLPIIKKFINELYEFVQNTNRFQVT
jgi:DNA-binding transcriptional LysR family regulator